MSVSGTYPKTQRYPRSENVTFMGDAGKKFYSKLSTKSQKEQNSQGMKRYREKEKQRERETKRENKEKFKEGTRQTELDTLIG